MTGADGDVTVGRMRRTLSDLFQSAALETPALDARLLIQNALGADHAGILRDDGRVLQRNEIAAIGSLAARRLAHEPVARIVGEKEFWGLPLRVTPAVLVPRPETETIVSEALRLIDAQGRRTHPIKILDIGTGSGAILLALLSELPHAFGLATDISVAALAVACDNAQRLKLSSRVQFVACDFAAALSGKFDLIVSNPPYVESATIVGLMPEVRDYDPPGALDGGADGLDAYRRITADIVRLMGERGHVLVEVGAGQAETVAALFVRAGLATATAGDLAGSARVVRANEA
jgi:release factor glutamine methyltransferase